MKSTMSLWLIRRRAEANQRIWVTPSVHWKTQKEIQREGPSLICARSSAVWTTMTYTQVSSETMININIERSFQRATRLFYSEILNLLPHLQQYKMSDAEFVVRAIRDTDYPLKEPIDLLPLIKSCDGYDDAFRAIQNLEETSRAKVGELSLKSLSTDAFLPPSF